MSDLPTLQEKIQTIMGTSEDSHFITYMMRMKVLLFACPSQTHLLGLEFFICLAWAVREWTRVIVHDPGFLQDLPASDPHL